MRYHEIASGLRVPVSGEEQGLINRIGAAGMAETALADERDQELALRLLRRGLLDRSRDKAGNSVYHRSSLNNLDRDRDF